jgi:hypothetical protein
MSKMLLTTTVYAKDLVNFEKKDMKSFIIKKGIYKI